MEASISFTWTRFDWFKNVCFFFNWALFFFFLSSFCCSIATFRMRLFLFAFSFSLFFVCSKIIAPMCPVGKMKSTCLVPSQSKVLVDAPITLCVWLVVCNLYNPQLADLLEPLNIRVVSILNLRSSVFLRLVLLLIQQKASSKNKTKQTKKRLPRSSLYNKNSVVLVLSCSTLYCRHCRYLKQIGRHKGPHTSSPHAMQSPPCLHEWWMNDWMQAIQLSHSPSLVR